jgi:glyoxylase-like metal-dependent hydrolase (beta-lactamase superfamily II)
MKTRRITILFCASIVMCIAACAGNRGGEIQIITHRISPRVAVYEYLEVNVTAVKSKDGIIIIDSHRSPVTMKKIMQLIKKEFGRTDVRYVINTHGDYDHSSGNQVFPGATIIGHDDCPEYMRYSPANSPSIIRYHEGRIKEMKAKLSNLSSVRNDKNLLQGEIDIWNSMLESLNKEYVVTPPATTLSDSLSLHLGDLTLRIMYCGRAHTNHDLIIYIPEEHVLVTGDLFTSRNSLGFSVNKMVDAERIISSMGRLLNDPSGVQFIIPGHGEIISPGDFAGLRDLLKEKIKNFEGKLSAARFLESLVAKYGIQSAIRQYSESSELKKPGYYTLEKEFSILGNRYLAMGRKEEAIGVLTLSTSLFPKSPLLFDDLAGAYVANKEFDSAIVNYERSLKIFPQNKNAVEMLKVIRHQK